MESLHPSEIELGLDRIQAVARRLGLLQTTAARPPVKAKLITVAGTNGKGSCVATMERVLVDQGYRVGAYTSPHILCYNERIRIQGECVSDSLLCHAFARVDAALEQTTLTYFELGTLAAFLIFADTDLDYWLLEIGLGGRLDAVNIFAPDVAVITSIDIDHTAWLGPTRDLIAREKLGILRSDTPCVCAEPDPTASMQRHFDLHKGPLYQLNRDFFVQPSEGVPELLVLAAKAPTCRKLTLPKIALPINSVAAGLQALQLCKAIPSDDSPLHSSLAKLSLAGRFDIRLFAGMEIIFDVAHNPAACRYLAKNLATYLQAQPRHVTALVAMMADKDIAQSLASLVPWVNDWCVSQIPGMARSAVTQDLRHTLVKMGVPEVAIRSFNDVECAFNQLTARAGTRQTETEPPLLLVFGSFYNVAEAMATMQSFDGQYTSDQKTTI